MKMKYTWDITVEKNFNERQLETIEQISDMISRGCRVKTMKKKFRLLNL